MTWALAEILQATGGRLLNGPPRQSLRAISTDTRGIEAGDLFVALRGDRFDGHAFLDQAVNAGAAAVLVDDSAAAAGIGDRAAIIAVADTLRALGDLARHRRLGRSLPLVGITGSNGKTSTKEMLATILEISHRVLKNQGNFNNLLGVPLTLLKLEASHQAAVIEMGINVPGEMAQLVRMTAPTAGLITNIQPAHLEGLGSEERVLQEKGLLWRSLGAQGLAAVNLDDPRLAELSRELTCRRRTYSCVDPKAEVRPAGPIRFAADGSHFDLVIGSETVAIDLAVLGRHQVQNAVAAAAMAHGLGIPAARIGAGLARHRPVRQRMATIPLAGGAILVDDTYNANPRSTMAALQAVREAADRRPVIAVLGEMRELGVDSLAWHRRVGEYAAGLGLSRLITCGEAAREIGIGALAAGLPEAAWRQAQSHAEATALVLSETIQDTWILVKGSRGAAMEHVVKGIMER